MRYFVFVVIFLIHLCHAQKYEFDECDKSPDGIYYCRKQKDCKSAVTFIKGGNSLKICSKRGSVSIVCCPPSKPDVSENTVLSNTVSPDKETDSVIFPGTVTKSGGNKTISSSTSAPKDEGIKTISSSTSVPINEGNETIISNTTVSIDGTKSVLSNTLFPDEEIKKNSKLIVEQMCQKYAGEQFEIIVQPGAIIGDPDTIRNETRCTPVKTLIVGGTKADPMEFPHMALIGYGSDLEHIEWRCGGSLISDRYVLSAAHCSNWGDTVSAKWVRLGELDYSTKADIAQDVDYEIIERITHPRYRYPSNYDDIVLFKLDKPVIFNAFIRPICLNTETAIPYEKGISAGWGVPGLGFMESEILLQVEISLVNGSSCSESYGINEFQYSRGIEDDKMICAGEVGGGRDTCLGDSGGPLMVKLQGQPCLYSQIGIVSFGDVFCGRPGKPGVYTRVSNYIDWIQKIVWP